MVPAASVEQALRSTIPNALSDMKGNYGDGSNIKEFSITIFFRHPSYFTSQEPINDGLPLIKTCFYSIRTVDHAVSRMRA